MKLLVGIGGHYRTTNGTAWAGRLGFALAGAEVIKIENPGGGDLARKLGCMPELNARLMGTSFLAQNANKKSITLNLKAPDGLEVLRKLAATADVLVENFRPGVMARLGVSYDRCPLLVALPCHHLLNASNTFGN